MRIKYKNKIYSSQDIPLFFYFKESSVRDDFIKFLADNILVDDFKKSPNIPVILAGNTVIKDKRSAILISFETLEEKKALQKSIFFNPEDSNAFLCSPPDIEERSLELWIEKYIDVLK